MIVYPLNVLGNRVIVEDAEPLSTISIHDAAVAFRRRGYVGYIEGNHWYVFQRASNGRSPKAYAILKTGEDCRYNGKPAVIMPREKPYHIKPRFVRVVDRWGAVVNNFRYPIPGLKHLPSDPVSDTCSCSRPHPTCLLRGQNAACYGTVFHAA